MDKDIDQLTFCQAKNIIAVTKSSWCCRIP